MHTGFVFCKRTLLTVLILLGCIGRVHAQTGIDSSLSNALQFTVDSLRIQYNLKGISAAAYLPGKGMWKGVSGESYAGVPIDTTMLFSIGSVTKTFVAAEIFKLVEAGMLSLGDTVGALLPPMINVNPAITVRQLLNHTSGMGDYTNPTWQTAMNADLTKMWYFPLSIDSFCTPASSAPGGGFNYRNANYNLLGMIIEAKKSDSLHKVLRADLLLPQGLSNTHMELFEPYANVIPHNWSAPTLNPALAVDESATPHQALWSSVEPAGGYFSDAADLAKWGYNLYSGNVLSATSLSQMLTFNSASSSYFNGYGLGVQRFTANGRTYYGHAGNYFGYAASMVYYPQDSICVAVLINVDCIATFEARALMNTLINKVATGVHEQAWTNKITISPNPANKELNVSIPGSNGLTRISIRDVMGREVYLATTNTGSISVSTKNFEPGNYFITIVSGDREATRQVVIGH